MRVMGRTAPHCARALTHLEACSRTAFCGANSSRVTAAHGRCHVRRRAAKTRRPACAALRRRWRTVQAQLIGRLIGLDFPETALAQEVVGQELRTRGFKALTRVITTLAQRAPAGLLILIDDLHWADDASLDFIAGLVQTEQHAGIMLAMASRPILFDRRIDWMRDVSRHLRLEVLPLDASESLSLASQLLAKLQGREDAIERLLIERAEGNPYFMEELVRMLIDDGVIDTRELPWRFHADRLRRVRVPGTLTGTLQARLDALTPGNLEALQNASIIGSVSDAALAAIDSAAPRALPQLTSRALVDARNESAFEGTLEHAFHHQLLHDVTYSTVLRAMRERGHARAAEWLAERIGDRAGEFLGLTAEHFERAGNRVSALDYYVRAADDADARIANGSALAYIDRALALVSTDDPMMKHYLLDRRYGVLDRTSNQPLVAETLAMIAQHAEACDSDWMRASLLARRSIHADRGGDATQAEALARRGLPLAEANGNASAAALIHGECLARHQSPRIRTRGAAPRRRRAMGKTRGRCPVAPVSVHRIRTATLPDRHHVTACSGALCGSDHGNRARLCTTDRSRATRPDDPAPATLRRAWESGLD